MLVFEQEPIELAKHVTTCMQTAKFKHGDPNSSAIKRILLLKLHNAQLHAPLPVSSLAR